MAEDCKDKTLGIGETFSHEITLERGITVILQDVSPAGVNKAVVGVYFYWDEEPDESVVLAPGEYKAYTDPDGIEWRVYVDSTMYMVGASTASIRICFEGAKGEIVSIDAPASAKAGDLLEIYVDVKNVGGADATFFVQCYDKASGGTVIQEREAYLEPGQTLENLRLWDLPMPNQEWHGRIDMIQRE